MRPRDCHHGREIRLHQRRAAGGGIRHRDEGRHIQGDASHRPCHHTPVYRLPHLPLHHLHDVQHHIHCGRISHDDDREACRHIVLDPRRGNARRGTEGPGNRRHTGRRGVGNHLPSADSHPLRHHLVYGGFGIYGTRGIHHGPPDAQDGAARQVVHSAHHGIWMQRARRHGYTDDRKPAVATHHDAHPAFHVLLGTPADIYYDNGDILHATGADRRALLALSARHRRSGGVEPPPRTLPRQGRRHSFRDGTAALPLPDSGGNSTAHMGEGTRVSEEDGRHHSRGVHHSMGAGLLPAQPATREK